MNIKITWSSILPAMLAVAANFFLYAWEAIKVTAFTIGVLFVFYWFTVFMFLAEGVR